MLRTIGSCSARLRALPLDAAGFIGDAAWTVPPGNTCTLIGRAAAPLAAADAIRRASAVNDISTIMLDNATRAIRELPSSFHSAVSSVETNMGWVLSVLSTTLRRDSAFTSPFTAG